MIAKLRRIARTSLFALLLGGCSVVACSVLAWGADEPAAKTKENELAAKQTRLIDGRPFDQLILKDEPKKTLKLVPLELEKRRPFNSPSPEFRVRLRLEDNPEAQYEVVWGDVQELKLFEELVLAEAATLVAQKQFDEAYDYYQFLDARDAKFPGVNEAWQNCLFQEALQRKSQGRTDQTLALLNEVYTRNPAYPELNVELGTATEAQVTDLLKRGLYTAARRLIHTLGERYPSHPVAEQRQRYFQTQASQARDAALKAQQEGRLFAAYQSASLAVAWWPKLDGAIPLLEKIHAEYPVLAVGVTELEPVGYPGGSFAHLRRQRLLTRLVVEPVSNSAKGLEVGSSIASWKTEGTKLTVTVNENVPWFTAVGEYAPPRLTALDLVTSLARRGEATAQEPWTQVFVSGKARGLSECELELRFPMARPELWLQASPQPWSAGPTATATTGSYAAAPNEAGLPLERHYRLLTRSDGKPSPATQAREIVERRYADTSAALAALAAGEIGAVDRIAPWDVDRLARLQEIVAARYAAPSVHLLVPNPNRPLLAQRSFRRALSYGTQRKRVLEDLFGSSTAAQAKPLSGPFPLGPATSASVPDFAYDPRLMLALIDATIASQPPGLGNASPRKLVLVYPASAVARAACQALREQWWLDGQGLQLDLVERAAGEPLPAVWDLQYLEWYGQEPLVDAFALFSASGPTGRAHPWLEASLQRLLRAESTADAFKVLHELHRLVHDDLPVIPLWQMNEHFAHRKALQGLGREPYSLYQTIEAWRLPPPIPSE